MDKEEYEITSDSFTLDEVIQKAAKHLPEGHTISIEIEKDGYNVVLHSPGSTGKTFDNGGIIGEINDAICWANGFYE